MSTIPEHLSKELFEKALKMYFKDDKIRILDCSTLLPDEQSYTTDVLNTVITYTRGEIEEKETIKVITKSTHHNADTANWGQEFGIFEVEIAMYSKILPQLNNILGKSEKLAAECYYLTEEPKSTVILEDLTASGFTNCQRQNGLDLNHCILVVEKLARFHAASVVLFQKEPSLIHVYNEVMFRNHPFMIQWVDVGFDALSKVCVKWPGYEKYAQKLKLIQNKAFDRTRDDLKLNPEGFNVLNHGDAWINNFMFSYTSEGRLKDMKFIDFQFAVYGSPLIDLIYFWASSPTAEVRAQHFDEILHCYHKHLTSTLTMLQCSLKNVPTVEELKEKFNSKAFYGLASAVTVLPMITSPKNENVNFVDIFNNEIEDSVKYKPYNNECYRKHMEYLLDFFDNLKILD